MNNRSLWYRWSLSAAILALGCILLTNLKINENALDLLPGEALQGDLQLLQRLGMIDKIFLTLSVPQSGPLSTSESKRRLQAAVEHLGSALKKDPIFSEVFYRLPPGYEMQMFGLFQEHLPVLTDDSDLAALAEVVRPEAVNAKLLENYRLLNSPAGIALGKQIQKDPLGLTNILLGKMASLRSAFSLDIVDGYFMSKDGASCLLMAESRLPLTDSDNAEKVAVVIATGLANSPISDMQPLIIGSLPHTLANSRAIQQDLGRLLPVASLLLLLLLVMAFRNLKAMLILAVPFAAAPLAIGITNLMFDRVSTIALGFGIVLLGITVDFAIHIYLGLSCEAGSRNANLQHLKRPILLAATTTIAVFLVLLFSKVPAHRQMATLSLCGTIVALVLSWLLIPLFSQKTFSLPGWAGKLFVFGTISHPIRNKVFVAVWSALILAGIFCWPRLHYTGNLQALDIPTQQIRDDELLFQKTWDQPQNQAFFVARGETLAEALDANSSVYRQLRQTSQTFQSIAPLLPGPRQQEQNGRSWTRFWQHNHSELETYFNQSAGSLGFARNAFQPFFSWIGEPPKPLVPAAILEGPLQGLFSSMIRTPSRQFLAVGEQDDRTYLVTTAVEVSETSLPIFTGVAEKIPGVVLLANEKWRSQLEMLMKHDILTLSLAAGLAIIAIIVTAFKSVRPVLAVLAPVLSALSAMAAYCYISGSDLNMMHMLMGILVIGLSVDYGIFAASALTDGISEISAFAVSLCAASTLIGFGALAFASHPALNSLGVTVLIGIGAAWPTTLLITPIFLGSHRIGQS